MAQQNPDETVTVIKFPICTVIAIIMILIGYGIWLGPGYLVERNNQQLLATFTQVDKERAEKIPQMVHEICLLEAKTQTGWDNYMRRRMPNPQLFEPDKVKENLVNLEKAKKTYLTFQSRYLNAFYDVRQHGLLKPDQVYVLSHLEDYKNNYCTDIWIKE